MPTTPKLTVTVTVGPNAYTLQRSDFLHMTDAKGAGEAVTELINNLKATASTERTWVRT